MLARLLRDLGPFQPTLVGTYPLGLQALGSDLDIVCTADLDEFAGPCARSSPASASPRTSSATLPRPSSPRSSSATSPSRSSARRPQCTRRRAFATS